MEELKVVICDTEDLKKEAYRIRYKFYVEEIKVRDPKDYPDGLLFDKLDDTAVIFLGYSNRKPMITCRIIDYREHPFEMSQYINPEEFIKVPNCWEVTRLIALAEARKTGLVWEFLAELNKYRIERNIRYVYHARRESQMAESKFFNYFGSTSITEPFEYGKYGLHRIYEIDFGSETYLENRRNREKQKIMRMEVT